VVTARQASFGSFIYALVVSVVWAFLLGAVFGLMQGFLFERRLDRLPHRGWVDRRIAAR
jgi:NhaP-type Na+/H+ or K+/H+ antiporter